MENRAHLFQKTDISKLKQLSELETLTGLRAKALLMLYEGVSLNEAAAACHLNRGQVRYALDRYRKIGTEMFAAVIDRPPGKKRSKEEEVITGSKKKKKKDKKKKEKDKKKKKSGKKKDKKKDSKKPKKKKKKDKKNK